LWSKIERKCKTLNKPFRERKRGIKKPRTLRRPEKEREREREKQREREREEGGFTLHPPESDLVLLLVKKQNRERER